jgi:hypothetical protein
MDQWWRFVNILDVIVKTRIFTQNASLSKFEQAKYCESDENNVSSF